MCEAATIIGVGMGVASLATGVYSAVQQQTAITNANNQAQQNMMMQMQSNQLDFMRQISSNQFQNTQLDKQWDYQMRMLEMQREMTNDSADLDYRILTTQVDQVNEEASLQTLERVREGMRERARMRVAAAEAGIGGVTPERIQTNLLFQQGYDTALIEQDRENKVEAVSNQAEKIYAEQASRLNDTYTSSINSGFGYTSKLFENYGNMMGSYKYTQPATTHSDINPLLEGARVVTSALNTGFSTYSTLKKK